MIRRPNPRGSQVFICFRGSDVRKNFISFLEPALRDANINVFIDENELLGSDLDTLLRRIEESEIALVIFSEHFTCSSWCLDELVKIKECNDQDRLKVIPIFYKVQPSDVKFLKSTFGNNFRYLRRSYLHQPERIRKWNEALVNIPETVGISGQSDMTDKKFITKLIQRLLKDMAKRRNQERQVNPQGGFIVPARNPIIETDVPASEPETETTHQGPSVVPFMLRARELEINHSEDPLKWAWSTINEGPNSEETEIVTMIEVDWVKIVGEITTDNLTPGTWYEAVFVVKTKYSIRGWRKLPVTLKLKVIQYNGDRDKVDRLHYLNDYKGNNWSEILAGVFVVPPKNTPAATIIFTMIQYNGSNYKNFGLVVKGVVIRPKDL